LIQSLLSRITQADFAAELKIRPVLRLLQGAASERDGAAGLQRPQCGVRQRQRLEGRIAFTLRKRRVKAI
jgi:hypothetical protein